MRQKPHFNHKSLLGNVELYQSDTGALGEAALSHKVQREAGHMDEPGGHSPRATPQQSH